MYISIPDIFFVSVYYAKEDILNIKKVVASQQCNLINNIIKRKEIVIGVSLPTQRDERWVRDKAIMEQYAKEKGVTVKIENADYNAAKQVSQVENLISQGIDVLILTPILDSLNIPVTAAMVEKARKSGIKVISYDGLITNSDLDLYVSFNNIMVGELQGKYLTEKVPRGNYIILSGYADSIFKKGAMEYILPLTARNDIKIVTDEIVDNWDPRIAYKIVKDSLVANNNKIDVILATNDAIAGAAIEWLQEQGLAGKVAVTGQDAELAAIRRITQRTQLMTVFKDTRVLGKVAIDVAINLANGKDVEVNSTVNNGKIDVPSILITPIAIDKNNIDSVLIASGYLKQNEVYQA